METNDEKNILTNIIIFIILLILSLNIFAEDYGKFVLYKFKLNGMNKEILMKFDADNIKIIGSEKDWVFYHTYESNDSGIYKVNSNESNNMFL